MDETTNFYNEILNNNPKIVNYYTINPKYVIELSESKTVDALMLKDLAIELNKALNNEDLDPFYQREIKRTLVATVLAIKRIEKNNDINQSKVR